MNIQGVVKIALIGFVILLLSGCGTLFGRSGVPSLYPNDFTSPQSGVYPAVQLDWKFMQTPFLILGLIDLPISLVTDTLMLPVDVYNMHKDQ